MRKVTILKTGLANLASVKAAFTRLGASVALAEAKEALIDAERLVVPGVGAFGAALEMLNRAELAAPLRARIQAGQPTLGICLGLQIFGVESEESPGAKGLGVVSERVTGFGNTLISPQMGWNRVVPEEGSRLLQPGHAYFANSFCFKSIPQGWSGARADYGGPLVAALERGAVLGCQFHPELSGAYGEALLERWMQMEVPTC